MTSIRYSVDGGAWNFSIQSIDDTSFGSNLCTADTDVAMPNTTTDISLPDL